MQRKNAAQLLDGGVCSRTAIPTNPLMHVKELS